MFDLALVGLHGQEEDIGGGRPKDAQPCSDEHFCTADQEK